MRQTSRAVALLLAVESAQSADAALTANKPFMQTTGDAYYTTIWMPLVSDAYDPEPTNQLNSRTAGYNGAQQSFEKTDTGGVDTEWQLHSNPYQKALAKTTQALSVTERGSFCMPCIGAGSVWCSRTYSYLETGANVKYQLEEPTKLYVVTDRQTTEADLQYGSSQDAGSCCGSAANFVDFVGNQEKKSYPTRLDNVAGSTSYALMAATCVAFVANTAFSDGMTTASPPVADATLSVWGVMQIDGNLDGILAPYSSWWCSNGLYKNVQKYTVGCGSGECDGINNAQQLIGYGMNKRKELAMVGCPQIAEQCGQGDQTSARIVTALDASGNSVSPIVVTTGSAGPTTSSKCTWVATGYVVAPTFFMSDGAVTTPLGIVTSNWQIHTMEYTATAAGAAYEAKKGSLQSSELTAQDGLVFSGSALQKGNFIPRFNMPADQFATLRTWYGEAPLATTIDSISQLPASWLTPGQAPVSNTKAKKFSTYLAEIKGQQYGNVANVPFSTLTTTGSVLDSAVSVGNANFGLVNGVAFDLRVVRYFPAQVAQTVWKAGSDQQGLFVTAKAAYDTAKTAWDNYVALLEKNNKTDAFAALFSPPKAPTVPPMPNLPWTPNKYQGYVRATALEQFNWKQSTEKTAYTVENAPTAQQFWANLSAAQTVGGWGSFTAQILRYRNGWGKSFGTIGYSGDADKNKMSAVWNYMWTCAESTSKPGTTPCDATYTQATAPTSTTWTTTTGATAINAVTMVSVVTLWSTSNMTKGTTVATTQFAWSNNSFSLQWVAGAWSPTLVSLQAIADPVAATAAKGLSGVAGAQALAATSAAALAVAAALY